MRACISGRVVGLGCCLVASRIVVAYFDSYTAGDLINSYV